MFQFKVAKSQARRTISGEEIKKMLDDFRSNEECFYPGFPFWLSTGNRNAEPTGFKIENI